MSIAATAPDESLAAKAPGVYVESSPAPQRSGYDGVYAAVSTDLLNAISHAAWVSGALKTHFARSYASTDGQPLTIAPVIGIVPSLRTVAPADSLLVVDVEATLPPVASEPTEGLLGLEAADVSLRLSADIGGGELVPLLTLSVGVHAEARAVLDDDQVSIEIVRFDLTADVAGGPPDAPYGDDLDRIVDELLAPPIMNLVRFDGIPLPAFAGFRLESPAAATHEGYLRFEAQLVASP